MLPSILLPFLPIAWVLIAGIYWWRQLPSPMLFFVAGLFAVFGIQTAVRFVWDWWPQLFGSYFLEANNFVAGKVVPSAAELQRVFEQKNRVAVLQAGLVFVIAIPFLCWLKNCLSVK